MPEIAGTIPAVRERPKVAKRPSIVAPPMPERKAPAKRTIDPPQESSAPLTLPIAPPENLPVGERNAVAEQDNPLAQVDPESKPGPRKTVVATTIPVKKPLVKRKPQIKAPPAGAPAAARVEAKPPIAQKPAAIQRREPKAGTGSFQIGSTIPEKKPLITKQAKAVKAAEKEKSSAHNWISWLPIAAGIAIASVAPQLHALAAHWDPWGLRALFPFVQFAALHEIGMSDELTRTLPQLMLYLQFPLEGLLVASNLRKGMRFPAAVGPIPALHFVAGLVLWIVALGSAKPI